MPPKVKKETEDLLIVVDSDKKTKTALVPVFNLDNLNPALLPELATFKEKQLKVVEDNPFVKITDTASRDLAKKYRTARVSARTALQAQDKLISSKFNEAKTRAKSYIGELIDITLPGETEQQTEIDRDEAELEAKRQEKARLEKLRIDNIKAELDRYSDEWKVAFNLMTFDTIENVGADFYESYTTFDTTILQEFDSLFPTKIEELTKLLEEKTTSLTEAENARLEKVRLEEEAKELAKQKAELEAKQRLADEAEAKAKAEREAFEKEKAEFEAKKKANEAIANAVYDLPKTIPTVSPEMQYGVDMEEKGLELLQTIDSSVPENTTANVCTSLEEEKVDCIASRLVPIVDEMNIAELKEMQAPTTWESIIEEFTTSGGKSFSKWLKDNYNPPTKIQ